MTTNNDHQKSTASRGGKAVTLTVEEWDAWRKAAGLHVDPKTAEVIWLWAQVADPYAVWPDPPEQGRCLGRSYFACSPGMDVWIEFGDLPKATRDALWEKHKDRLVFPAGLESVFFVQRYLEQSVGSTADLSEDEALKAVIAGYQAYLDRKKNEADLHEQGLSNRDDGDLL